MMKFEALIFMGLLIAGGFTIALIARAFEKKAFNNGYCKECGNKLRYFDTDSQGGRGYICDKCGHCVWVSYNVDKGMDSKN